MPRHLFHQGRQGVLAEAVDLAPHPVGLSVSRDDRELEAKMREPVANRARQRRPIHGCRGNLDRLVECQTVERSVVFDRKERSIRFAEGTPS